MYSIYLTEKTKNTVGYDCTGIIVLDSNRVQLFPQSLLATQQRGRTRHDRGISSESLDNMVREKYIRQELLPR